MNRTILTPILVFAGLLGVLGVMAGTNLFDPIVKFVHSSTITPLGAGACLLFTVAGFASCFFLLNLLCTFFVPRIRDASDRQETQAG